MNTSFFLTRQTANLMEDFVRELASDSAFYLLYGSASVGKTRLLTELKQRRLADRKVVLIDLDESSYPGDESFHKMVEQADERTIFILDHFDQATNKARHSVFREWSVNGIDKGLNFVVACRDDGFNEFRQLSQQYHVSVQSSQLLPFNQDEVQAFLAFYLFNNNPLANLSIDAPLRKQLKQTDGVVGQIITLAEREKAGIREDEPSSAVKEQRKAGYLLGALIIFGAVGVGLWFLGNWSGQQAPESQSALADVPGVVQPAVPQNEVVVEAEPPPEAEQRVEPIQTIEVVAEAESVAETVPEVVEVTEDEPRTEAEVSPTEAVTENETSILDNEIVTASVEVTEVENQNNDSSVSSTSESVTEPLQVASETVNAEPATEAASEGPASETESGSGNPDFDAALSSSLSWIESNEGSLGTIQIMSIGFNQFSTRNYFRYLDSLRDKGVDVSQIRVFRTKAGDNEVYTIIYGQYADRRVAFRSIEGLPAELRANAPIPRTLAGILGEIDQLSQ